MNKQKIRHDLQAGALEAQRSQRDHTMFHVFLLQLILGYKNADNCGTVIIVCVRNNHTIRFEIVCHK